jgi:hypothetical protein
MKVDPSSAAEAANAFSKTNEYSPGVSEFGTVKNASESSVTSVLTVANTSFSLSRISTA